MLEFNAVTKSYPRELGKAPQPAVEDVSFSLGQGKTLGLIGANGAGKSTSIKLIMDFIRPDKGTIRIRGNPPQDHLSRQRIGYLPEVPSFPPELTVLDLLRFTGLTCNLSRKNLAADSEKWLTTLALWEARHKPLRSYSKGMQQRASFAIALIANPDMLILDEPMSGLDPIGRADVIALIRQLRHEGKTILFCSHILDDVDRLADDILVLHKGASLFYGSNEELNRTVGGTTLVESFLKLIRQEGTHA